jgi:hypothetical protein
MAREADLVKLTAFGYDLTQPITSISMLTNTGICLQEFCLQYCVASKVLEMRGNKPYRRESVPGLAVAR